MLLLQINVWQTSQAAGACFSRSVFKDNPANTYLSPQGFILQRLAAKLGVATGRHLAQHCR